MFRVLGIHNWGASMPDGEKLVTQTVTKLVKTKAYSIVGKKWTTNIWLGLSAVYINISMSSWGRCLWSCMKGMSVPVC